MNCKLKTTLLSFTYVLKKTYNFHPNNVKEIVMIIYSKPT